jgi:hypothetical protein
MIQETMCSGEKAVEVFNSLLKDWNFCYVDIMGLSIGLLIA